MINLDYQDTVAVVELNRGKTNALNLELVKKLQKSLQQVKADPRIRGVVLVSSNDKFFSIGFDIPRLIELHRKDFRIFYQSFNQVCLDLFTFPKPTVAAITGHAIAGGCILALCCDYRLIGEGHKLMGLNEIKLGVPVPYLADCALRSLVGVRIAREIIETGEFFPSKKLFRMGMIDQILPLEKVLTESIEKVRLLGSMPADVYAVIKQNRVESISAQVKEYARGKEEIFLDCWYAVETRKQLKLAIEKF